MFSVQKDCYNSLNDEFEEIVSKVLREKYDTLLFQLDSEYNEENGGTEIGDGGVINFFINSKALEDLNFEDVLYNWDCY